MIALLSPSEPEVSVEPSIETIRTMRWNTGQFPPGDYTIVARITEPGGSGYDGSGAVLTEKVHGISIVSSPGVSGSIGLNPPVVQADMQTPVEIGVAVRNTGNVAISTILRVEVEYGGEVVYSADREVGLGVNEVVEYSAGSFVPSEGGDYTVTVRSTGGVVFETSKVLYAGPHASAVFTVSPEVVVSGDAKVEGRVRIVGAGSASGGVEDPLLPLIEDAIQRGVDYEQPEVMRWHTTHRCYGCHTHTQALYGLEVSRTRVVVDDGVTRTIFDAMKGWQNSDGSVGIRNRFYRTQTSLALWAFSAWHDDVEVKTPLLMASDYLLGQRLGNGSWTYDPDTGHSTGWWRSPVSVTAITIMGMSRAYGLSRDGRYLDAIVGGAMYLSDMGLVPGDDNMLMAFQLMGLEASLRNITDQALRENIYSAIETLVSRLRSNQKEDGGWGRYTYNQSDSLVTAQVLYALTGSELLSGTDRSLRDAVIFLLNNQAEDGSWYSQNGILSTKLSVTTWVIISLPSAFERIGGIDTDLYITFPDSVVLDSSVPQPVDSVDGTYHWSIRGVMEEGREVVLGLTVLSLKPGEKRLVASSAELTFENTFTGEMVSLPVDIPLVTGTAPVVVDVATDNSTYMAGEDVIITSTITNYGPDLTNPYVWIGVEDMDGNVVSEVDWFSAEGLNPSVSGHLSIYRMDDSTVGVYHMNGSWEDSSGLGNHGTSRGASFSGDAFLGEYAGWFDGRSYVDLGNGPSLDIRDSVTIEAWIKPESTTGIQFVVGRPYSESSTWDPPWVGWHIGMRGNSMGVWLNIDGIDREYSAGTISPGRWHHIAMTFDGTWRRAYVNGVNVYVSNAYSGSMTFDGNPHTVIGVRSSTAKGEYYRGLVDEVAIWNRALSADEIREHYERGILLRENPPLPSIETTHVWNTDGTLAGEYVVRTVVYEDGVMVAEGKNGFTILPDIAVDSRVSTPKMEYNPGEGVEIDFLVTNTTANYILEGLEGRITVRDSGGGVVFTRITTIPVLTRDSSMEITTYWDTGLTPPGTYTVTLDILLNGETVSGDTTEVTILSTAETGMGLGGTLEITPLEVYQGRDVTYTYTITNNGNTDIQDMGVKILIVETEQGTLMDTLPNGLELPKGGSITSVGSFSTGTLTPGKYLAILQVDTTTTTLSLASMVFEVVPGLDIRKTVRDMARVLVWINDGCQEGKEEDEEMDEEYEEEYEEEAERCVRQDLIENALNDMGIIHRMVTGRKDFQRELRNEYYTDYIILGGHHHLEDHYDEELRERVFSGRGLVASRWKPEEDDEDEGFFDMKISGVLKDREGTVEFTESEVFPAMSYGYHGKVLKVKEYDEGDVIAWITDRDGRIYPGALKKEYGMGRVVFYPFNVGITEEEGYETLVEILGGSIGYVHTAIQRDGYHPYEFVGVELRLESLGGEFIVMVEESYPSGIMLMDGRSGAWIGENPMQREIHLSPGEVESIYYLALMPDAGGEYTLTTGLSLFEGNTWIPYETVELTVEVVRDGEGLMGDIRSTLHGLDVSDGDRKYLDKAIRHFEKAIEEMYEDRHDVEDMIHDLIKSIDSITKITSADTDELRLMMDRLLGMWEEMWYLEPYEEEDEED